jgi:hypothetical protein
LTNNGILASKGDCKHLGIQEKRPYNNVILPIYPDVLLYEYLTKIPGYNGTENVRLYETKMTGK